MAGPEARRQQKIDKKWAAINIIVLIALGAAVVFSYGIYSKRLANPNDLPPAKAARVK